MTVMVKRGPLSVDSLAKKEDEMGRLNSVEGEGLERRYVAAEEE